MLGIVIVTFNSADVIDDCLAACLRVPGAHVMVVDNASTDDTVQRVRSWSEVRLVANESNRGFAGGVNQGIAGFSDDAVLILNPDATPMSGITALEQAVREPGVGAAAGSLTSDDGEAQHGFNIRNLPTALTLVFEVLGINRLWPNNPVNRRYRMPTPAHRRDVEQPAGAFLMLRRSAWAELGGLDEGFFPVWFEDVDYCKRLRDAGYRIVYVPEAVATHRGAHSVGKLLWNQRQVVWYGSLLRYASKHFSGASRTVVSLAVVLGVFARSVLAVRQVGFAQATSVLRQVVCRTSQCLRTGDRRRTTPAMEPPVEEQFKQSR